MAKRLIIVESPTKAKTIKHYVGKTFSVKASVGHIKDLPKSRLGVDVENGFGMELEVIRGKKKVIDELKDAAKKVDEVLLAPDPDREGEAIAWHIAEEVKSVNPNVSRVTFNEITRKAVLAAIKSPRALNQELYDAQQARRVLDRLVGYKLSPLLWDKVRRGLSAGRVQSVAVRLVVEREQEIQAFKSEEYWSIEEVLSKPESENQTFVASLSRINEKKPKIENQKQAEKIKSELKKAEHRVVKIERKNRSRKPNAPFTTSTLQQIAASSLRYSAKRTMRIAQQLYEGIEIEGEGSVGLITYMRTDSTRVSPDSIEAVRDFVKKQYGHEYVPKDPNEYKTKKGAQDAHEAIRPTNVEYTPEKIEASLTAEQYKLYDLIWRQFVSSQMKPAIYDQTSIVISAGKKYELRATGSICKFAGFLKVAKVNGEEEEVSFPDLEENQTLILQEVKPAQHFTQPPPRFSEGTLVKELEERGIGRPSTYASILDTIQSKSYVEKIQNRLYPTELGFLVTDLLIKSFPNILDAAFTASMEKELDGVEEGTVNWIELIGKFYQTFSATMETAKLEMRDVKREEVPTEHVCEQCGNVMVIKWGRNGYFLACSGYPACKNTKEIKSRENGKVEIAPPEESGEICEKCGKPMIVRRGRFGRFLACSGYPECKTTKSVSTGIDCPECGKGKIVERRSKKGRVFFSCNRYPKCEFSLWNQPVAKACPQCDFKLLVRKETKREGPMLACPNKDCGYKQSLAEEG